MKNYYKEIAQMLGLELDEEFEITKYLGYLYKINENGLYCKNSIDGQYHLESFDDIVDVLTGEETIVKKPYKPNNSHTYWCAEMNVISSKAYVGKRVFDGNLLDYANFYVGNCFKTQEEALKHRDEIIKKLKEHYENS